MILTDYFQVLILGFATGFGSAFGIEIAHLLVNRLKNNKKITKNE